MLMGFLLQVGAGGQPTKQGPTPITEMAQVKGDAFACTSINFRTLLNHHFLTYL
jgi:hypothetical protein